nr:LPS assembly protein LptD [Opitutales bacterium]
GLELSADGPIEYDPIDKHLIATDNAQLISQSVSIKADKMEISSDNNYASASGNIILTNDKMFVGADSIDYNLQDQQITANNCKIFSQLVTIDATRLYIERRYQKIDNGVLYFGQPDSFAPNISVKKFEIRKFRTIHAKSVVFKIGKLPIFYLPACTFPVAQRPFWLKNDCGIQRNLGGFIRNDFYFRTNKHTKIGGLLDIYTRRGILFGPALHIENTTPGRKKTSETKFGFIHDRGSKKLRNKGNPSRFIKQDRFFLESKNILHFGENFDTLAQVSLWSDPEVMRDFRPASYFDEQIPDSFVESTYSGKNFVFSAFSRLRLNNFHDTVSQTPDLHAEMLPRKLAGTKIYHRAFINYSHLKGRDRHGIKHEGDKFDEYYGIFLPVTSSNWLSFTPMAGIRAIENFNCNGYKDYSRFITQVGFDANMLFSGRSNFTNEVWEIHGLKHIIQPVIQYRYIPEVKGDAKNFPIIEHDTFDTNIPTIDLSEIRNIDEINPQNMFRLGVKNTIQTSTGQYIARDLLKFNIFQDVILRRNINKYTNKKDSTLSNSYIFFEINPIHWLSFQCYSQVYTKRMTLQEITTSTSIHDANVWKLEFLTHCIQHDTCQYGLRVSARLNSRIELSSLTQYDARIKKFTEQRFSLKSKLGHSWNVEYFITLRNKASRESRCQASVKLDLIEF